MPGAADGGGGPVLVSVTAFRADRRLDLPGIYRAGMRLRRIWPQLTGAVGMWLWAEPLRGRSGSVSVWRDQAALHRFVAWPEHVKIMQRYRGRGQVTAATWTVAEPDRETIWADAVRWALTSGGTVTS